MQLADLRFTWISNVIKLKQMQNIQRQFTSQNLQYQEIIDVNICQQMSMSMIVIINCQQFKFISYPTPKLLAKVFIIKSQVQQNTSNLIICQMKTKKSAFFLNTSRLWCTLELFLFHVSWHPVFFYSEAVLMKIKKAYIKLFIF